MKKNISRDDFFYLMGRIRTAPFRVQRKVGKVIVCSFVFFNIMMQLLVVRI